MNFVFINACLFSYSPKVFSQISFLPHPSVLSLLIRSSFFSPCAQTNWTQCKKLNNFGSFVKCLRRPWRHFTVTVESACKRGLPFNHVANPNALRASSLQMLRASSMCFIDQSWFKRNYLSINESKTKILPLGDNPPCYELFADRTRPSLEVVHDMKLLGLTIDSPLSFKTHIKSVCAL